MASCRVVSLCGIRNLSKCHRGRHDNLHHSRPDSDARLLRDDGGACVAERTKGHLRARNQCAGGGAASLSERHLPNCMIVTSVSRYGASAGR
jgi:hypothetical protein